jgi:hypothetical protein
MVYSLLLDTLLQANKIILTGFPLASLSLANDRDFGLVGCLKYILWVLLVEEKIFV